MGDFNTQTFKEIWHGKEYRRLRQELKTNSLRKTCSNCPMKKDSGASADDAFTEKGDAP
jgi:MoaA/NifB/PqqE/SkfB family radical SAM enzyme